MSYELWIADEKRGLSLMDSPLCGFILLVCGVVAAKIIFAPPTSFYLTFIVEAFDHDE